MMEVRPQLTHIKPPACPYMAAGESDLVESCFVLWESVGVLRVGVFV